MVRSNCPIDLTDQEWVILDPLIPSAKPKGRLHATNMHEMINTIWYLNRTCGQWPALPYEFAAWSTVWSYFRKWTNNGTWQRMHTALHQQTWLKQEREPTPSATIIDGQSNQRQACQTYGKQWNHPSTCLLQKSGYRYVATSSKL